MKALAVVAETEGFALVENGKQLASYSGLDVVHHQSGLRHGQTSISNGGIVSTPCGLYASVGHYPL